MIIHYFNLAPDIVDAGFLLPADSPDLGLGRHMFFADKPEEDYQRLAGVHVEVLNYVFRNIPADRVRMHDCWGNYERPHHHKLPKNISCTDDGLDGSALPPFHAVAGPQRFSVHRNGDSCGSASR